MKLSRWLLVGTLFLVGCASKPVASDIFDQAPQTQDGEKATTGTVLVHTTGTTRSSDTESTVEANFPVFAKNDALNRIIEQYIDGFLQEFGENSLDVAEGAGKNTLTISFQVITSKPKLVSVYFTINTYYSGAAHEAVIPFTFTYDPSDNRELSLSNIFMNEDQALAFLSTYSRKVLGASLTDKKLVEEGTAPDGDNFSAFTIQKDGSMTWYFAPYQVAPYAEGMQQVTVPYEKLKGLMVDFIIARLKLAPK